MTDFLLVGDNFFAIVENLLKSDIFMRESFYNSTFFYSAVFYEEFVVKIVGNSKMEIFLKIRSIKNIGIYWSDKKKSDTKKSAKSLCQLKF